MSRSERDQTIIELVDRLIAAERRAGTLEGQVSQARIDEEAAQRRFADAERARGRAETDLRWSKEHEGRLQAKVAMLDRAVVGEVRDSDGGALTVSFDRDDAFRLPPEGVEVRIVWNEGDS